MSDNTINAALGSLGYYNTMQTAHGLRATARTIMEEVLGERVDLIEHQLAHAVKDANGRAYNRTAHLAAPHELMQRWSDYLDRRKGSAKSFNSSQHNSGRRSRNSGRQLGSRNKPVLLPGDLPVTEGPKAWLMALMSHSGVPIRRRVAAAKVLMAYC